MTLIKLTDARLGETEVVQTPDGIEVAYSSRARSLVDAVYDWSRFNSLPRGYGWIRAELSREPAMATEIVRIALAMQTSARSADSERFWSGRGPMDRCLIGWGGSSNRLPA